MPTEHIIALLIAERDRLNRAIDALQGPFMPRGRPSKKDAIAAVAVPAKRGRRSYTAAQRKAQGEKMRAYWAQRKKTAK